MMGAICFGTRQQCDFWWGWSDEFNEGIYRSTDANILISIWCIGQKKHWRGWNKAKSYEVTFSNGSRAKFLKKINIFEEIIHFFYSPKDGVVSSYSNRMQVELYCLQAWSLIHSPPGVTSNNFCMLKILQKSFFYLSRHAKPKKTTFRFKNWSTVQLIEFHHSSKYHQL